MGLFRRKSKTSSSISESEGVKKSKTKGTPLQVLVEEQEQEELRLRSTTSNRSNNNNKTSSNATGKVVTREEEQLWESINRDLELKRAELLNNAKKQTEVYNANDEIDDLMKQSKKSWLTKTKFFKDMIKTSFELVDQDGSNDIDEKELYSGLLLIHLKLGCYAGPAACKPITREKCHAVFVKMDHDNSGHLNIDEFEQVIMVLFGNVLLRVLAQNIATIIIVPFIAQYLLLGIIKSITLTYELIISTVDDVTEGDYSTDAIEVSVSKVWSVFLQFLFTKFIDPYDDYIYKYIPNLVFTAFHKIQNIISNIPDSVWAGIPITLLSSILSMILIPWSLMKIDDYFQNVAQQKKSTTTTTTEVKKNKNKTSINNNKNKNNARDDRSVSFA